MKNVARTERIVNVAIVVQDHFDEALVDRFYVSEEDHSIFLVDEVFRLVRQVVLVDLVVEEVVYRDFNITTVYFFNCHVFVSLYTS